MIDLGPIETTRHWIDNIVVGLNLCPFAGPVIKNDRLHCEICAALQTEQQLASVLEQLDKLQQADIATIETSLLIFSEGLVDFDEFWGLVEIANELLEQVGLSGVIQIASFHPDYLFDGVAEADVSHYTNRSPYPMLHFIREAQLSHALQHYPDSALIPERNIKRLQQLGKKQLLQMLTDCHINQSIS